MLKGSLRTDPTQVVTDYTSLPRSRARFRKPIGVCDTSEESSLNMIFSFHCPSHYLYIVLPFTSACSNPCLTVNLANQHLLKKVRMVQAICTNIQARVSIMKSSLLVGA